MKNINILLLLLLLVSACTHNEGYTPKGVLGADKFAGAYVGLMKIGVQAPAGQIDSLAQRERIDSLFRQLGTSRELFQASVAWYNQDPARWRAVMDSATKLLDEEQSRLH